MKTRDTQVSVFTKAQSANIRATREGVFQGTELVLLTACSNARGERGHTKTTTSVGQDEEDPGRGEFLCLGLLKIPAFTRRLCLYTRIHLGWEKTDCSFNSTFNTASKCLDLSGCRSSGRILWNHVSFAAVENNQPTVLPNPPGP